MPTELTNHQEEGFVFKQVPVDDILKGAYDKLDPDCRALLLNSVERMPWRLYVHQPYSVSGCLLITCEHVTHLIVALVQESDLYPRRRGPSHDATPIAGCLPSNRGCSRSWNNLLS